MVVPIHIRTQRVRPTGPNVKFEKRRYVVSVWAIDEQEGLTFQNRGAGVIFQPGGSVDDELDAHQTHLAVRRLVDQGLWVHGVERSIKQVGIDVVDAHGAVVCAADAAEERAVSRCGGARDVLVLPGRIANNLNQLALVSLYNRLSQRDGRKGRRGKHNVRSGKR